MNCELRKDRKDAKITKRIWRDRMPYEDEITPYGTLATVPPELESLAHLVIGAAIEVHRELGPGMSEEGYQKAMAIELALRQVPFEQQRVVDVIYKGVVVAKGKIDILVA